MIVTKSSVPSPLTLTSPNKDFDYESCLLSYISYAFFQGFLFLLLTLFIIVSDSLVFYCQLKFDAVYNCFLFSII